MQLSNFPQRKEIQRLFLEYSEGSNMFSYRQLIDKHNIKINPISAGIDCIAHASIQLGIPHYVDSFSVIEREEQLVERVEQLLPMSGVAIFRGELGGNVGVFQHAAYYTGQGRFESVWKPGLLCFHAVDAIPVKFGNDVKLYNVNRASLQNIVTQLKLDMPE